MTIIFFLKMLCDSALYYAFTAPVALFFGGGQLMPSMVLQSVFYALARSMKRKVISLFCLLPLAVCYYLCLGRPVDLFVMTPMMVYILWQVLRDAPVPQLEQQRELLEKMWKPLLGFGLAAALLNSTSHALALFPDTSAAALEAASGISFSFSMVFFFCCVALLRTLRHNPEVYSQRQFHFLNIAVLLCIVACALLLGSKWAVGLYGSAFHAVYTYVLVPIFLFIAILPTMLFNAIAAFLKQFIPDQGLEEPEPELEIMDSYKETFEEFLPRQTGDIWKVIGIILLIAFAAALLFYLIRKALRTPRQSNAAAASQAAVTSITAEEPRDSGFGLSPVYAIRRQYRKFLKLCRSKGLVWKPGSTSREIAAGAEKISGIGSQPSDIRALYIRARYRNTASYEDARQMRSLVTKIQKGRKTGR